MSEDTTSGAKGRENTDLSPDGAGAAAKPRRKRKRLIVLGVVVVVILAAGAGGAIWHKQPSFCNAICHTPMDHYVEGFESDDEGLLIATHKNKANLECLDCHEASVPQQAEELVKFVTGNYAVPLPDSRIGTKEFCFECHGSYSEIAELTRDYDPLFNPHESHYEELECYQCHSMHEKQEFFCTSCHQGLKLPEGWKAAPMT